MINRYHNTIKNLIKAKDQGQICVANQELAILKIKTQWFFISKVQEGRK